LERLTNPSHSDVESTDKRHALWQAGIAMAMANPVFGVGVGNFKRNVPYFVRNYDKALSNIAHNTYVSYAAELGLPGLIAFLAILIGSLRSLERIRTASLHPSSSPELRAAASGVQVGLVSYIVAAFFVSAEYQKFFWLVTFVGACLPRFVSDAGVEPIAEPENGGSEPAAGPPPVVAARGMR
jgi:O-antigen ligase